MVKFYYTAVSNSLKRKLEGSVLAESEKDARERLNKIGMAILSIAAQQPPDWENAFEFSVIDKIGREFSGELIALSPGAVLERLADEFDLRKINYICSSSASEEEKLRARENGVREIVARKQKEEEEKTELERRTLSGSLKSLVNMGEKKEASRWQENLKKFSSDDEEDLTKKTAADVATPDKPEAQKIHKVNLADVSASQDPAANENPEEKKVTFGDRVQKFKDRFVGFFPDFSEKFGKFYFLLTEIVVPPSGKTRADGWHGLRLFLFPPREASEIAKAKSEAVLHRRATFERIWVAIEEIVDLLAAVFLAYFGLGIVALHVAMPRISALAETTLRGNLMIPFLAGVFIFLRILIFLRAKFTSWSFLRTSLLFLTGGLIVVFAGMNLL
ncbi:MAG: hypothetical protein V1936_01330 [Patescibacteria group bacterium]